MAMEGHEAVEKALDIQPDLILLDILMPGMDGWQVLERLRKYERSQKIPVIILTGKGDSETLHRCQQQKVTDYFIKPIKINELLAYIARYVPR